VELKREPSLGWLPALLVATVTAYVSLRGPLSDLDIYRGAVAGLKHGTSLYDAPFTYPPFAGLLMTPMTGVPEMVVKVLWTLATVAAVLAIARLAGGPGTAFVLFLSAPVSSDLRFGQVSIFLALLVLIDVLKPPGKAQGVLIGLAAAIKLTPLLFIPMLWIRGQRRAAITATGTFLACGTAAAAILPGDSWRFWLVEVRHVNRLGPIASAGNQSLNGALIRRGLADPAKQIIAVALGGLVALIALHRSRTLDPLAATVVVGAASVILSPVSWTHHQVWLVLAGSPIGLAAMILPVWGDTRLVWALVVALRSRRSPGSAPGGSGRATPAGSPAPSR
jgi:alpha-1,2-mannosyltransferase